MFGCDHDALPRAACKKGDKVRSIAVSRWGAAALAAMVLGGCGGPKDGASIESARQYMAKGELATAVVQLKSVLQQSPQLAEARYLMGVALLQQGDPGSALLELSKAQDGGYNEERVAPKLARAMLATDKLKEVVQVYGRKSLTSPTDQAELKATVAVAHARLGQRAESQAAIDEALKADPKSTWALLSKARLQASAGQFDEALATVSQAIAAGRPNGEAYLLQGALLRFAKKDVQGALKSYEEAAKEELTIIGARAAAAQTYLAERKLPEAKAQLAELQKTHPKSAQTHFLDAVLAYAGKDYARADALVESLLRYMPTNPQLLLLGGAANLQQGNLIAAETKLGKVVQTVEYMPLGRKLLAETYLRMGQPEKGLAALRPLMEQAKPDGDALALAGQANIQLGRAAEAEAFFTEAAKLKPNDTSVRTALALTNLAKGNADAAFAALQQLAATDTSETADLALISAHLRRREFDAALKAIDGLAKKQPGKPMADHLRGQALRGKGDLAAARAAYESALKQDPKHAVTVMSLADLDMQEGKVDNAKQRLEAAIKADPRNVPATLALLNIMVRQKAPADKLLAVIDASIKAAPTDPNAQVAKITQLSMTGDTKAAAGAAQAAIAAFPQSPQILEAAGRALSRSGDDQQAITAFNKLTTLMPRSALPYLRLADVYERRGDAGAVGSNLNRAFEAEPGSADVHRRLIAHATRTKDYKPVLSAARELQKRYPGAIAGYMLEGDAEVARKAWPAAMAAYRAAMTKANAAARPHMALYLAMVASGDKAGAERFVQDWLKANPKDAAFRERLGSDAIARKDYVNAERLFREVVALQPKGAAGLNNLAWLLAERGDKSAVEVAERALARAPGSAPVMDTLAKALGASGQLERAIEVQKGAITAMPERVQYRLNLVHLLVKAGRKDEGRVALDALASGADDLREFKDEVAALRKAVGA
jgi:putative PEP-CTERM system TPR-repeat lipoprotein